MPKSLVLFFFLFYILFLLKQNVAPSRCYPGLEAFIVRSDWHVVIQPSQMVKKIKGHFGHFKMTNEELCTSFYVVVLWLTVRVGSS